MSLDMSLLFAGVHVVLASGPSSCGRGRMDEGDVTIYSAEMVVAPPLQLSGGKLDIRSSVEDLSALAGGLGDLSSLASGASGGTKEYRRFLAMITSGAVAERLYQNPDLLHAMLHKSWDEESKSWRQPGPIGQVFRAIDVFFDMPVFDRPTVGRAEIS